jgi:hypothetical protein
MHGNRVEQGGVVVDEGGAFDEVEVFVLAGEDDFAGDLAVGFEVEDGGFGALSGLHPSFLFEFQQSFAQVGGGDEDHLLAFLARVEDAALAEIDEVGAGGLIDDVVAL